MMDSNDLNLSERCFLRVFLRENPLGSSLRYALASADDRRVIDGLVSRGILSVSLGIVVFTGDEFLARSVLGAIDGDSDDGARIAKLEQRVAELRGLVKEWGRAHLDGRRLPYGEDVFEKTFEVVYDKDL